MNPNFVNNCSLSYKCPMVWEELEGSGNIRSCNKCDKEVYWCNDPVEYYEHAANQDCVAFYTETDFKSNEPPKATLGVPAEPGFGKLLDNFFRCFKPKQPSAEKSDTNAWAIIILGIIALKMVKGIL